jgi:hypothetical protein
VVKHCLFSRSLALLGFHQSAATATNVVSVVYGAHLSLSLCLYYNACIGYCKRNLQKIILRIKSGILEILPLHYAIGIVQYAHNERETMICQWILEDRPAEVTLKCEVGCISTLGAFAVYIKSPRTGKCLTFNQNQWDKLPNQTAKRIRIACGLSSKATVDFTTRELQTMVELHNAPKVTVELPRSQYPALDFSSRRRR